jgi:tetratricopeptide (TPR) repeat protein
MLFMPVLDRALEARDRNALDEALSLFQQILDQAHPGETRLLGRVHGLMGGIYYFQMRDAKLSEQHFRESVRLLPESELASLGLYHSLVAQDRWVDALTEMVRLLSLTQSGEYQTLLDGYADSDFCDPQEQELIEKARALVRRWGDQRTE